MWPPVSAEELRLRAAVELELNVSLAPFSWSDALVELEAQWPLDVGVPRGSDGSPTAVPPTLNWADANTTHRVLNAPPTPNNAARPAFGMAGARFGRLVPRADEDLLRAPLPSARLVSNRVFAASALGLARSPLAAAMPSGRSANGLLVSLVAFVAHDLAGELLPFDVLRRSSDTGECCNIAAPRGDPQWDAESTGTKALPFRRALSLLVARAAVTAGGAGISDTPALPLRTQEYANSASSFLDLSHVYGTGDGLRAGRLVHSPPSPAAGLLVLERTEGVEMSLASALLPSNGAARGALARFEPLPNANPRGLEAGRLFLAGDARANVLPGVVLWHTLLAREHT
jgi:hypothetical protein